MKHIYTMFAGYNRWANRRIYDAARACRTTTTGAPRGAFFGSLHGTLNHLVVADRIWMRRFTGDGAGADRARRDPSTTTSTRSPPHAAVEDERIVGYIDGLTEADLAATFSYRTIATPQDITQPLAPALSHFFNHQTHHRGQAHGLLSAIGGNDAAPSLDLILYQRETGVGLA